MPRYWGPCRHRRGALVVLRGRKAATPFAVAQSEVGCFLAVEKFLDHEFGASRAEARRQNDPNGSFRLGNVLRAPPRPCRRRARRPRRRSARRGSAHRPWLRRAECESAGRRRSVCRRSGTNPWRKPLEPSSCAAARLGPKALMPAGLQVVHNAGAKRTFLAQRQRNRRCSPDKTR